MLCILSFGYNEKQEDEKVLQNKYFTQFFVLGRNLVTLFISWQ
jgi:hypothetical protein